MDEYKRRKLWITKLLFERIDNFLPAKDVQQNINLV